MRQARLICSTYFQSQLSPEKRQRSGSGVFISNFKYILGHRSDLSAIQIEYLLP